MFPDRVSVGSAGEIARIVGLDVGGHRGLIFDVTRTEYVDSTAAAMIARLLNAATARGNRDFVMVGLRPDVALKLRAMGFPDRIPEEHLVPDMDAAKPMVPPMLEEDIANDPQAA